MAPLTPIIMVMRGFTFHPFYFSVVISGSFLLWGHSRLGHYFSDTRLKEFVALDLVFTMIYYYLINKIYTNK